MFRFFILLILLNTAYGQVLAPVDTNTQAPVVEAGVPVAPGTEIQAPIVAPVFDVNLFKNLKFKEKSLPLEFELFFKHIYESSESEQDQEYLVEISFKYNYYFNRIPKPTRTLLLKSEIVRNILEYKFDRFSSNLDINNFVIDKAIQKINKFKSEYNESSLFVINSCIGDLAKFYDEEILNNLKLIKGKLNYAEAIKVQEINAKTKYLRPWFYFFDKFSPGEFNDLILDLAFETFKNIETKAFLQSYFAPIEVKKEEKFFNLPADLPYQTSLFKIGPQLEAPPEEAQPMDLNTNQMIDNLNVAPLEAPPEQTIEQIEQELAPGYVPTDAPVQ